MIESYWLGLVIVAIVIFMLIEEYRLNRLQDRVDTVETLLKNGVNLDDYVELLSEVKTLKKEIRRMKDEV